MTTVLITGGSGFLGSHTILQALAAGYRVRTTVRGLAREAGLRDILERAGADTARLQFVAGDLMHDAGWAEAAAGCEYVLHVASPFPPGAPEHEDELIIPAREGTLRVLRAARAAGVRRVVVTSSFAVVGYGHPPQDEAFTEASWTNLAGADVTAYIKSKVLAERAAWDLVAREGEGMELAVINPTAILGPVLSADFATSVAMVKGLLDGMPASPRVYFGVVDVRDVAELHLRAMTNPAAAGERFIAVAGEPMSLFDVARLLRSRLGAAAARVPETELDQPAKIRRASNEKARRVLGWAPRSNEEAALAAAESLLRV